tara:strand:+ start:61 stop:273 length:213 start_codon:yes stop_codon:yes gene_type:complete
MYRLKQYKKGWIVEYKIYKWHLFYGVVCKWKHVTHYSGLKDTPFYYKTPEGAREGALREIKEQINFSFHF